MSQLCKTARDQERWVNRGKALGASTWATRAEQCRSGIWENHKASQLTPQSSVRRTSHRTGGKKELDHLKYLICYDFSGINNNFQM